MVLPNFTWAHHDDKSDTDNNRKKLDLFSPNYVPVQLPTPLQKDAESENHENLENEEKLKIFTSSHCYYGFTANYHHNNNNQLIAGGENDALHPTDLCEMDVADADDEQGACGGVVSTTAATNVEQHQRRKRYFTNSCVEKVENRLGNSNFKRCRFGSDGSEFDDKNFFGFRQSSFDPSMEHESHQMDSDVAVHQPTESVNNFQSNSLINNTTTTTSDSLNPPNKYYRDKYHDMNRCTSHMI